MDSRFKPYERRPGGRVVGTYYELWSPKTERRVRLDSGLEFHLFLMVEANWEISCFCEHPCIMDTDRSRQPRRVGSIPDMWIRYVFTLEASSSRGLRRLTTDRDRV